MLSLLYLLMLFPISDEILVFNFNKSCNIKQWRITNDDVMGGISSSTMSLNADGAGIFQGSVSLENNGGFAMTRLPVNIKLSTKHKKIVLHLKGDKKQYQFRIKSKRGQRFWYVKSFQTSGVKERIELDLKDFYAYFRGYKLNIPKFDADQIGEVAILIANKKKEKFKLTIDKIYIN